jgi:Tol biopolymer transport system component
VVGARRVDAAALTVAAALALVIGLTVRSGVSTHAVRPADAAPVRPKDAAPVRPADDSVEPPQGVEIITGSLAAVDPATGRSRSLGDDAKAPGIIGNAAWSAAGKWVAYDIHGETDALWVVSPEGERRQLAEHAGAWAWSPTDTQLAMMHTPSTIFPGESEGPVPVTLFDAPTGRQTDLGKTVGEVTTGPVWSPDGTRVVYAVRGGSIYSVDVERGDHTLLVRLQVDLDSIFGLEWSPDGAHIAILADVEGFVPPRSLRRSLQRLHVMNVDASEPPILVDDLPASGWGSMPGDPLTQIAWSPDGTRLTYATFSGPDHRELRVWTASLDGSAPSLIASHINDECCIDGGSPVWSPDGSRIAFETDKANETEGDYVRSLVVNADGTGKAIEIDWLTYMRWRGGWYFCRCYG